MPDSSDFLSCTTMDKLLPRRFTSRWTTMGPLFALHEHLALRPFAGVQVMGRFAIPSVVIAVVDVGGLLVVMSDTLAD